MKKKYIPQQELSNITDEALLTERHIVIDLISNNKFQFLKGYKDSKDDQFKEIEDVLSKAKKKDHGFLKNYYALPDTLKNDFVINKKALSKCPDIYFLIKDEIKKKYPISLAKILIKTNGYYFKYISSNLKHNEDISLDAVVSCPSVFKHIPEKLRSDENFIYSAITKNPHVYCQLSKRHKLNEDNLLIAIENGLENNIEQFYNSIPSDLKDNKALIIQILCREPTIYKCLAPKHKGDITIARSAVKGNCKMIAHVPSRFYFNSSIIKAFINTSSLRNERSLIYEFKSLTKCNLNIKKIIKKFIDVLPEKDLIILAKKLSHENKLDFYNWTHLVNKNPKTFKYLSFDRHTLVNFHCVIERAIMLDYKNFQHIDIGYWNDLHDLEIYAEFLDLAIKVYQSNKCKGGHPVSFLKPSTLSIKQLKSVVKHKVDGKDQIDYVNIFKYGNNAIKRNRSIYIKALNIDPSLANLYPFTKRSRQKTVFNGLNLSACNALFDKWIQYQGISDVLEIASIKTEILKHSPQNVAITT